jgi:hypothetical protein
MYVDICNWIFFLKGPPRSSNLTAHRLLSSLSPHPLAIFCYQLCCPLRHHHPTAHHNCFAFSLPIAPPLPITAAAVHCNHTAAIHCDCRCCSSCIASLCTTSALAAILRCPLCCPLCHCCLIAHRNHPAVLPPIGPPLPIAAASFHRDHTAAIHRDCRCHPSHVASHCAASASTVIVRCSLCRPSCCRCPIAHHNCFAIPPPMQCCCPSPMPMSIAITPLLSIVIATAIHVTSPPIVTLLHWWQLSAAHCAVHCATTVSLPIAITPPSCHPLCHLCPLLLPPLIAILPPSSIAIATAIHLALPPIAPLLHWRWSWHQPWWH